MNCALSIYWKQYQCIIATTYEHLFALIVQITTVIRCRGSAIFVKLWFISALWVSRISFQSVEGGMYAQGLIIKESCAPEIMIIAH